MALHTLANNRENILLAELAAWLHDVGKFSNIHLEHHTNGENRWGNSRSYKVIVENPACSNRPCEDPNCDATLHPVICTQNNIRRNICGPLGQILTNTSPTFFTWLERLDTNKAHNWQSDITSFNITVLGESWNIAQLILLSMPCTAIPYEIQRCFNKNGWLSAALGVAHQVAHHDKQDGDNQQNGPQIFISTAFGYELFIANLDDLLKSLPVGFNNWDEYYREVINFVRAYFSCGVGDTRRPTNEVTLKDWGWTVAALFKSTLVHKIINPRSNNIVDRNNHELSWRLLSLRTNGLEYILSASSIPDLLVRKAFLNDALNKVQVLLEEVYPLGLEVYRDENGSVFVVPDIEGLLGYEGDGEEIKNYFENKNLSFHFNNVGRVTLDKIIEVSFKSGTVKSDSNLSIGFELSPEIKLSDKWDGQSILPPIGKVLKETPKVTLGEEDLRKLSQEVWQDTHYEELCTVCGLRPQGWGANDRELHYQNRHHKRKDVPILNCKTCKAISRKLCYICEQRRADRAKEWTQQLKSTIWLNEVADANGRMALIVGRFDLTHWLDGTLVRSLAVRTPNGQNGHTVDQVAKNPSFARLRRIWETTRRFWQDVAPTDTPPEELQDFSKENNINLSELWEGPLNLEKSVAKKAIGENRSRIFLKAENAKELKDHLGSFHAYALVVQGRKVNVLWVPPDGKDVAAIPEKYRGGFWVIENLEYLEKLFEKSFDQVLQKGAQYEIHEPGEYGRPGRAKASLILKEINTNATNYIPLIPIFAEPQVFMAMVPADKAMDVIQAIKAKYEREMGKVRNRLPLHLGVVFAPRRQPLRALLDAGKKMLNQPATPIVWNVRCAARKQIDRGDRLPQSLMQDQNGQFNEWYEIHMEDPQKGKMLTWHVPARMGDGQTEDHWYPYAFLASESKLKDRNRYFQSDRDNPWQASHSWLVHVGDLKLGDKIYFTPATFDFEFLDANTRRHEIWYDGQGRRPLRQPRPYLLDEIDQLKEAYQLLNDYFERSQYYALVQEIERKREEWFGKNGLEASVEDPAFQRFVEDAFRNARTRRGQTLRAEDIKRLSDWAVRGYLRDALELYQKILKL